ncbi:hypothetical protein J5N97_025312 [Dioscorea zingiberensis]|uniref:RRM domain-containing protein n=1 Tax=Dioscorea zingiberensis TaxID=325984 RepID=A0A9D5C9K5_9LILI|nr:hypothetical protein J5N97_025312 [Dioscorea zingiberensis]
MAIGGNNENQRLSSRRLSQSPSPVLDESANALSIPISSYGTGESVTALTGGMGSHRDSGLENQNVWYSSNGRHETPLQPDTSNTIYMDGLRADCTCRAVAHIFCPFVGFRKVRLVSKESGHPGADPLILCFIDFGQAAVIQEALQGYKFDEHDRQSANMWLQFS